MPLSEQGCVVDMKLTRGFEYSRDIIFLCDGGRVVYMNGAGRRKLLRPKTKPSTGVRFANFWRPNMRPPMPGRIFSTAA